MKYEISNKEISNKEVLQRADNKEVLQRADAEDFEITLIKSRLRWLGHVSRMDDNRPVKALMYGELDKGTRPVGRPKLRYKDTCKNILKSGRNLRSMARFGF